MPLVEIATLLEFTPARLWLETGPRVNGPDRATDDDWRPAS